jgi:hypothetical protein
VLLAQHAQLLAASAIAAEVAAARGYRSVTEKTVLARCGFAPVQQRVPALLIPVRDVCGEVALYQARPDDPRVKDGKTIKYETRRGAQMVVDVPPRVRPQLGDPRTPLLVTEGVRKADSAVSVGLCCVALLGVWNWRGTNEHGGQTALADWEQVALKGRTVYVVFDSDATTNPGVYEALARLKGFLERRGASVQVVYLPGGPEGGKVGLDDFLAAGHSTTELYSLASPELRAPSGVGRPCPYEQGPGGIVWHKPTRDGSSPVLLTNFTARIVTDEVEDDGVECQRRFELEASLGGRKHCFTVPASRFRGMTWVTEHLGAEAIVAPGVTIMDHTRAAIQHRSHGIEKRRVYTHAGWRQIDGEWLYLHGGGAIGASGAVDGVDVRLPDALRQLQLPSSVEPERLREAARASLDVLELAPDAVTVALLAAVYRAPLGDCDFSGHVAGPTGAGKTELAALAQQHYGAGFDARHLPGSWLSTGNALEAVAFAAKDAVLVVDDFAPTGSQYDVQRAHREADRLLRAQGNRAGRQRLRPDATLRAVKYPRGLIISTGEDVPRGQSLRARILSLELEPDALDWTLLTRCQTQAGSGVYAQAMAGYLTWLASRYEELRRQLPDKLTRLREAASAGGQHQRTPVIVANLALGLRYLLAYAHDAGAISVEELHSLWRRGWQALTQASSTQAAQQQANEPAHRFLQLVTSALASGRAHIASCSGHHPDDKPEAWGWRQVVVGTGDFERKEWRPQGDRIGWLHYHDDDDEGNDVDVYLDPDAAYAAVQALGRGVGDPLTVTPQTLRKRLNQRGLLASTDQARQTLTVRRTLEGKRRDVLHLHASTLELSDQDEHEPDQEGRKPDQPADQKPDHTPHQPQQLLIDHPPAGHHQARPWSGWSDHQDHQHGNPTRRNPHEQTDWKPSGQVGQVGQYIDNDTALPTSAAAEQRRKEQACSLSVLQNLTNPTTTLQAPDDGAPAPGESVGRPDLGDGSAARAGASDVDDDADLTSDDALEHALDRLIAAGQLFLVPDDLRWAPAPKQPPWRDICASIEIGRHVPRDDPLCRHPGHRGDLDWRASDGRLMCGICHPPAGATPRPQPTGDG